MAGPGYAGGRYHALDVTVEISYRLSRTDHVSWTFARYGT